MQTSCETEPSLTQFNGWFSRDSVRHAAKRWRSRASKAVPLAMQAEDSRSQQNDQRPDHSL